MKQFADRIGDVSDADEDSLSERIVNRFVAEIESEFKEDLQSDYLKLCQLFDPRISYRCGKKSEAIPLLDLFTKYYKPLPEARDNPLPLIDDDDFDSFGSNTGVVEDDRFDRDYDIKKYYLKLYFFILKLML